MVEHGAWTPEAARRSPTGKASGSFLPEAFAIFGCEFRRRLWMDRSPRLISLENLSLQKRKRPLLWGALRSDP
jgi:hypothetical protein